MFSYHAATHRLDGTLFNLETDFPPPGRHFHGQFIESAAELLRISRRIAVLHKANKMRGYHLVAIDGEIGHVDDFLIDEGSWAVQYLVVDTSNWVGGKSVLVSTATLEAIDSVNKEIRVKLTRDEIERSPEVDSADIELVEKLPTIWIM